MKKIAVLFMMSFGIFILSSCRQATPTPDQNNVIEPDQAQTPLELTNAFAKEPVLLTSAGQSADVDMLQSALKDADKNYAFNKIAKVEDLENIQTVFVVIGGSTKGMGAAGIDSDEELKRVGDLLAAARENNCSVIAFHLGGEGRRGELSDKFIDPVLDQADYLIVVESGNQDEYFTKQATRLQIPIKVIPTIADVVEAVTPAFE